MSIVPRASILLVEDDVRLAELVRGYLENNGFPLPSKAAVMLSRRG